MWVAGLGIFLLIYLGFGLYLLIRGISARNKTSKALYAGLLLAFFVIPWVRDVCVYASLSRKGARIITEIPKGFSADQLPAYLEQNKERLRIRKWHTIDVRDGVFYVVLFDSRFCVLRLLTGRGHLIIDVDGGSKTVRRIAWVT